MVDLPIITGLFDKAGQGLSPLFQKMEDYQREVVDDKIKGHILRNVHYGATLGNRVPVGQTLGRGIDPASIILSAMLPQDDKYSRYATGVGKTGKAWVDEAYKESPWQNFLSGAVLDPTNLIGFGVPGMGARALSAAPQAAKLGPLIKGMELANKVDAIPGQVTGKAVDLGLTGGRKLLGTAADAIGPMIPDNPGMAKIGNAYSKTLQGWRENALLSPAYHLNNYVGNVIMAAQSGDDDVFRATAMAPLRGRSKEVTDTLTRLGNNRPPMTYPPGSTPPPIDPESFGAGWSRNTQKLGREPNINNPLSTPSVFRDFPDTVGPANWARDKVSGLSEASKRFGQNRIEGPGVDAAFLKTFKPEFTKNANEFYRELRLIPDSKAQAAADALQKAKGQISPDDLREILYPGTRARRAAWVPGGQTATTNKIGGGMPQGVGGKVPDWRDDAIKNWENRIISSMEAGTKNSTGTFFDYTADNPIDRLGQNTFAFHRFAINNLPKAVVSAGKNPVYANIPTEYYRTSDNYNERKGLPRRMHGSMPLGGEIPGLGQLNFDPMGITPMGSLVKSATRPPSELDEQGTPIGEVADDLRSLGLGLNPFIDALLTVTGQHGRSFAPSFLRASQPVNGALGAMLGRPVDIEGWPKEILGNAQEELTGQRPFPYQEYLLRKRQAELKALGKDPKLAGDQVGDQMGIEGIGGFAGIPGLKLLTPEEQVIRRNTALANAYKLAGNQEAYRSNPTSRAYADLDPRDEQVRNWANLSAADRQRLLRDPEVRDELLDAWAMQLHGNKGRVQDEYSNNPWAAARKSKSPNAQPVSNTNGQPARTVDRAYADYLADRAKRG